MTVIALVGSTGVIDATRAKLEASPLDFLIVDDPETADLIVTDAPAPTPNYLSVAAADTPNRFYCTDDSVDYVVAALTEAYLIGAHGVRVRRPVQDRPHAEQHRSLRWRRTRRPRPQFDPIAYDWASDETVDTEVFDDDVVVTVGGEAIPARLRARGYTDTNDGHFHWAGILHSDRASDLKRDGKSRCTVALPGGPAVTAKLAELTQWGTVRMTGVGTPPWLAGDE